MRRLVRWCGEIVGILALIYFAGVGVMQRGGVLNAQLPTQTTGHLVTAAEYNAIINAVNSFQNQIAYFNASACPTGWAEFTDARGRYIVGLTSSGTLDTGVGTALTNQENRDHTHSVPGLSVPGLSIPGLSISSGGGHTHTYSGTSSTVSVTHTHTFTTGGPDATSLPYVTSGVSNAPASSGHTHSGTTSTDSNTAHAHTYSGTTSSDGSHDHGGATGTGTTGTGTSGTGTSGSASAMIAPYIQLIACKKSAF